MLREQNALEKYFNKTIQGQNQEKMKRFFYKECSLSEKTEKEKLKRKTENENL